MLKLKTLIFSFFFDEKVLTMTDTNSNNNRNNDDQDLLWDKEDFNRCCFCCWHGRKCESDVFDSRSQRQQADDLKK
jgi:hypothetical protein